MASDRAATQTTPDYAPPLLNAVHIPERETLIKIQFDVYKPMMLLTSQDEPNGGTIYRVRSEGKIIQEFRIIGQVALSSTLRGSDVGTGLCQVSPVAYWHRHGHFKSNDEARGAFRLAYQQAMDGMGPNIQQWMGLTEEEFAAWMRDESLPPLK